MGSIAAATTVDVAAAALALFRSFDTLNEILPVPMKMLVCPNHNVAIVLEAQVELRVEGAGEGRGDRDGCSSR
jgi:hypothetical protein